MIQRRRLPARQQFAMALDGGGAGCQAINLQAAWRALMTSGLLYCSRAAVSRRMAMEAS